jgi:serine/threonine protein kinase
MRSNLLETNTAVVSSLPVVNYHEWLQAKSFIARRNGPWASVGVPRGEFNWKLHVSATQVQALGLLEAVVPILAAEGVPFKVALDSDVLSGLNEGMFGATQVGKFMTVYPNAAGDCLQLARLLVAATRDFSGPRIVTDLHLGAVVYARYGSHNPMVVRDRLGNLSFTDDAGSGGYKVPFRPPLGVENPFDGWISDLSPRPDSFVRGRGYLILAPLSIHAKGTVFLCLDVRRQGEVRKVVLKEGRRHCLSDPHGRDICDRLRHQERVHKELAGRVRVPMAADAFEFGENLYLPLEFIEGHDLTDRAARPFAALPGESQRELIAQFRKLVVTVADLHGCGYVHRDLSPRNVRIAVDGEVYLLDLEISHRVGDTSTPPFMQGTMGFVSPQQLNGEPPTFLDDIYSLGCLLIYTITGFDPRRIDLLDTGTLLERLRQLSGAPEELLRVCCECLEVPSRRPGLLAIDAALSSSGCDLAEPTAVLSRRYSSRDGVADLASKTAREGLEWVLLGCPREPQSQLWASPELSSSQHETPLQSPHAYRLYRSTNRGVAGVVYTLARAHRFGFQVPGAAKHVGAAVDWLLAHAPTQDDQMPGLHFGEAGVAVAIAETVRSGLVSAGPWLAPYLNEALSGPLDWPDMTHGAAGQGSAAILCGEVLDKPGVSQHAHRCAEYLLDCQAEDGSWSIPDGVSGLAGVVYTGFAHGVGGIVHFLASYARRFRAAAAEAAAMRGGQWLLSQMREENGGDCWWPMQANEESGWRWWCHGGPGIALAFLQLYLLSGIPEFAVRAKAGLLSHPDQARHPNLSQCHGLAGYGEALLTGYHVLGDTELLARSLRIASDLVALRRQAPRGVNWLVENPYHPTADLMIGSSGVVHFLARVSQWQDACFGMPLTVV